jgi:hypothetical protein
MTNTEYYKANPVVSCGDEGEEGAVLFNPDIDETSIVNLTGKHLWHLLETPRTAEQLVAHLTETYPDAPPDSAADDVRQFLDTLLPDFIEAVTGKG